MNKQELIDDFINERKGIPPKGASIFKVNGVEFTLSVFKLRAKELGWISGYEWGVEYPTNGEKPDLPDDVVLKVEHINGALLRTDKLKNITWEFYRLFKIVDERYKPKESDSHGIPSVDGATNTTFVGGRGPAGVNGMPNESMIDNSWYGRGEWPPVGVECEVKHRHAQPNWARPGFYPTTPVFFGEKLVVFRDGFGNETAGRKEEYLFRPIKSEREKFGLALWGAINFNSTLTDDEVISSSRFEDYCKPFDAGFRKPD